MFFIKTQTITFDCLFMNFHGEPFVWPLSRTVPSGEHHKMYRTNPTANQRSVSGRTFIAILANMSVNSSFFAREAEKRE